jgi:hypothetical protein
MTKTMDRRSSTRAQLEAAQDAFVIALRRLRALEEVAAQLRAPLDLEHAHDLWSRIAHAPLRPRHAPAANQDPADLELEVLAARARFHELREALRQAEAAAALVA